MNASFRIHVVEDDPIMGELLASLLAKHCQVRVFTSAEISLAALQREKPDLFLVDVGLPGINGYELCRRLKADYQTRDIPITFISGNDSIETRLAGYEAGGEDFLIKPFEPPELLSKLQVAQRIAEEKAQLRQSANFAQQAAFSAMTSMGELGLVLEFMRKSFAASTATELSSCVLDAIARFGFSGAVQVRIGQETHNQSPEGSDLPLEAAVLNHLRTQGRIFEFRDRAVYNFGGVTLLVKNLPLTDPDLRGRMRDNLAILAESADARRSAIEIEQYNQRTRSGVQGAVEQLQSTVTLIHESHQKDLFERGMRIVDGQTVIERALLSLGLTESQEEQITRIIRNQFDHLRGETHATQDVTRQLGALGELLSSLTRP